MHPKPRVEQYWLAVKLEQAHKYGTAARSFVSSVFENGVPRERKLTESRILCLFAGNTSRKRFLQNRVAIAREKNRRSFA